MWARQVNDRGGVKGHLVNLIIGDDGGDPARHRALVQEMVERRHVIAFIGNPDALSGEGSVAYHNQVRVPVIGSDGGNDWMYANPMFFPQIPHGVPLNKVALAAFAAQLLPEGKSKLATIVCQEAEFCKKADATWAGGWAKEVGFDLVYRARVSLAQPDFTAECLSAQNAGAEILVPFSDINSVSRIATSCARQGYRPVYGLLGVVAGSVQEGNPLFEGAAVAAPSFPWFAADTQSTAEFQAAMARYAPKSDLTGQHTSGWTAAKLFERAAANLPEPPTAAAVLEGLWGLRDETLGGLTYPLTFLRDQPAPPKICWFNIRMRNGNFTAPEGTRNHCR